MEIDDLLSRERARGEAYKLLAECYYLPTPELKGKLKDLEQQLSDVCIEAMLYVKEMYEEALARGFKGWRIFGEMACFFEHSLIQELIEYERALHRVLDIPIIGICAYDTDVLTKASNSLGLYIELLKAHSTVLFTGLDDKLGRIEIR